MYDGKHLMVKMSKLIFTIKGSPLVPIATIGTPRSAGLLKRSESINLQVLTFVLS